MTGLSGSASPLTQQTGMESPIFAVLVGLAEFVVS
jgi:hypothetical protein